MATIVANPGIGVGRVGIVTYLRHFVRWYRTAVAIAVTTGAFGLLFLADNVYAEHRQAVLRRERLAEASKLFGPASPYARFHLDATSVTVAPIRMDGPHAGRELTAVFVVALLLAILVHRRRTSWAAVAMVSAVAGVVAGAGPLANVVQPNSVRLLPWVHVPLRPGSPARERALRTQANFALSTFDTSAVWRAAIAVVAAVLLAALVLVVLRLPTPTSPGAAPALLDFVALISTIAALIVLLLCWPSTDLTTSILDTGTGVSREFVGSLVLYPVTFAVGIVAIRSTRVHSRRLPRRLLTKN